MKPSILRNWLITAATVLRFCHWRIVRASEKFWLSVENALGFGNSYLWFRRRGYSRRVSVDMARRTLA